MTFNNLNINACLCSYWSGCHVNQGCHRLMLRGSTFSRFLKKYVFVKMSCCELAFLIVSIFFTLSKMLTKAHLCLALWLLDRAGVARLIKSWHSNSSLISLHYWHGVNSQMPALLAWCKQSDATCSWRTSLARTTVEM